MRCPPPHNVYLRGRVGRSLAVRCMIPKGVPHPAPIGDWVVGAPWRATTASVAFVRVTHCLAQRIFGRIVFFSKASLWVIDSNQYAGGLTLAASSPPIVPKGLERLAADANPKSPPRRRAVRVVGDLDLSEALEGVHMALGIGTRGVAGDATLPTPWEG